MSASNDIWGIAEHPLVDRDGHRLTLEEALVAAGDESVLPPRKAADIAPLVNLLDKVVLFESPLAASLVQEFYGAQFLLSRQRLAQELGPDYEQIYSCRDWTAATEAMLIANGCPKAQIDYGKKYRVNFNADAEGGILVVINESVLSTRRGSSLDRGKSGPRFKSVARFTFAPPGQTL